MSNEHQFLTESLNAPQNEKLNVQSNKQRAEQAFLLTEQPGAQSIILNEQQFIPGDEVGIASTPLRSLLSEENSEEASVETESSSCVEELRLAMRDKEAEWCERLAVQAGNRHDLFVRH